MRKEKNKKKKKQQTRGRGRDSETKRARARAKETPNFPVKPSQPRLYSDRRREPCAHRTIKRYFIICSSLHRHSFIYLLILAAVITPVSEVLREKNNKNGSECATTTTTTSGSKTDIEVLLITSNPVKTCQ